MLLPLPDINPSFRKPVSLLPTAADEIAKRHEFAIRLQESIQELTPRFNLSAAHVAVILTVPLYTLERHGRLSVEFDNYFTLESTLNELLSLVKHFLQGSRLAFKLSNASRSSAEEALCRERDGRACVVTGTKNPATCHIIPFVWNDTQAAIKRSLSVISSTQALLGLPWIREHGSSLVRGDLGSSDKCWNMLCLDRHLRFWWSRGHLAFKCLGSIPIAGDESMVTVTLQFNWMLRDMLRDRIKPSRDMNLHGDNNDFMEMVERVRVFQAEGNPVQVPHSSFGIKSGHLIHVVMPATDAPKFKAAMDLQWACIKIASISGASNYPDLLPDHDDWEGVDKILRTERWVAQQAERPIPPRGTRIR
ncbi:hypothetical protein FSARC_3822 [Fusarium sarcochroum]|uniref:HNH nuclease domain-containing protein n=1 Tax=Fusarium sarcochroum TaxID=1208366 RepID=A0A8H4XBZ1_9HYPO|nr:hypothetical protein FSARC_3822 [Fusarium sarcochroum]